MADEPQEKQLQQLPPSFDALEAAHQQSSWRPGDGLTTMLSS
jgi:hypothetical protein